MLYTLMRCIHSFKTTCQNTDVDARFKLYLNITPALYPNVVCLVMCIHMCELADVVVRYNSAQQVVLDGRPYCQSKPMRPGVGASGRHHYKKSVAVDHREESSEFFTISEL